MKNDFITTVPIWSKVIRILEEERSALVLGPKHYRKTGLLRQLALHFQGGPLSECAYIELSGPNGRRELDYSRLFAEVSKQLRHRDRSRVNSAVGFARGLKSLLEARSARILLLIRSSGGGTEDEKFEMLASLHQLLAEEYLSDARRLSIVVTDDYSLWYHQRYGTLMSELHNYQKMYMYPLNSRDVAHCLEELQPADEVARSMPLEERARRIFELTGGHIGLVSEAVEELREEGWRTEESYWEQELPDRIGRSALFAWIQRAIQEAPNGLAETACEYIEPKYPVELRSSRVQLLLRLGILQLTELNKLVLCSGLIRRMMESVSQADPVRLNRLGLVIGESGLTAFEAGGVDLQDDDFVVVHLSDLHVGDRHWFRYRDRQGVIYNQDRASLAELVANDLASLSLIDRIDLLILSGDFVWGGRDSEFRLARIVVEELLERLRLSQDRLLLVPGNHDIDWGEPTNETLDLALPGNREAFADFAEHFGHNFDDGVVLRTLFSRSARRRLHVVGLDSNRVEGRRAAGIGYVSRDALNLAGKLLTGAVNEEDENETITWLTVHHHIFPATSVRLQEAQHAKVTVMANAAEILAYATQWGAELIVHGHEHQPSVTMARRWPTDVVGKHFVPVVSIGAGSAGVEKGLLGPFGRHQYFVLYRRKDDLIISSRSLGQAGIAFMPQNDMLVTLSSPRRKR